MLADTIVILDTDSSRAELISKFFGKYGINTSVARDDQEAIDECERNQNVRILLYGGAKSDQSAARIHEQLEEQDQPIALFVLNPQSPQQGNWDFLGKTDCLIQGSLHNELMNLLQRAKDTMREFRYAGRENRISKSDRMALVQPEVYSPQKNDNNSQLTYGSHGTGGNHNRQHASGNQRSRQQPRQNRQPDPSGNPPRQRDKSARQKNKNQQQNNPQKNPPQNGNQRQQRPKRARDDSARQPNQRPDEQRPEPQIPQPQPAARTPEAPASKPKPASRKKNATESPAPKASGTRRIRFGSTEIQIDSSSRQIQVADQPIAFTQSEYLLMKFLLDNMGRILDRQDIIEGSDAIARDTNPRNVDAAIRKLRRKIGDSARSPQIIKTVWGKGYLLEGQILHS